MSTTYGELALFYDLIYADVTADIPFYLELAQETGGPVLELGCGSGRTAIPLAEAGFELLGLDNSPAMLDRARDRLEARSLSGSVELVQADMTDFNLGRMFSLITVPFNTWMHLDGQASQTAALGCIRRHLAPGGKLVIDVPAPATIVEAKHDRTLTLEGTFTDPVSGETLLQFSSTHLDRQQRVLHVTWIYDRIGEEGRVKRTVVPMALYCLFPHQVETLLMDAGLRLFALWGDYSRSPYSEASDNLIVVAEGPLG